MRHALVLGYLLLNFAELFASNLLTYRRNGNIFLLKLSDSRAELEWISSSSFRFCRHWQRQAAKLKPIIEDEVVVSAEDLGRRLRFTTKYLKVDIEKEGLLVRVWDFKGKPLAADAAEIRREGDRFILEREAPPAERFRGLGPRRDAAPEGCRGIKVSAPMPLVMSTLGYGEYFPKPGTYLFDLAADKPNRRRVEVRGRDHVEYFFHYGPTPKEILEEHVTVSGGLSNIDWSEFQLLEARTLPKEAVKLAGPRWASWEGVRESLAWLFSASYSAVLLPAFDVSAHQAGEGALARRLMRLASLMPVLYESRPGSARERQMLLEERKRLVPYLVSYAYEAQDRGFPLIRPLGLQFAGDPAAAKIGDEFMLGDELLAAPVLGPGTKRTVYLPMGIWTHLRTNRAYQGRQTIEITAEPDEVPLFAKNGSILPLDSVTQEEPFTLHYFPRLGAEFFLYEEGTGELSQFHAAPALDLIRLETEPAKERTYEWIVHHAEPCRKVVGAGREYRRVALMRELKPERWFYDAEKKNLHVQARVPAGADHIINVSF